MDALAAIEADRVVAVVRAPRVADPAGLPAVLAGAGIRCVELTFTIPNVLDAVAAAVAGSDAVVGAGTVLRPKQARDAIAAGARFVVAPACVPELVEPCREAGVPVFIGAFSPTESTPRTRPARAPSSSSLPRSAGPRMCATCAGRFRTCRSSRRAG